MTTAAEDNTTLTVSRPREETLAEQLAGALLQDLTAELERRRQQLKTLPEPTPGQQEAGRQLSAAVAALYAADHALKRPGLPPSKNS